MAADPPGRPGFTDRSIECWTSGAGFARIEQHFVRPSVEPATQDLGATVLRPQDLYDGVVEFLKGMASETPRGGEVASEEPRFGITPHRAGLANGNEELAKRGQYRLSATGGASIGWYVDTVVIADAAVGATCATGSAPPPPVAESVRFTQAPENMRSVTYDATTCSAQKVIVLYNSLGAWNGYSGCAQPDGGNGGVTTVDSTGQTNVWYNLVWTSGSTAGYPGFASGDARTWNAGTLCGMNADDHGRATCP